MTIAQLTRRLRGAWNDIAASLDRMVIKMALEALKALVAQMDGAVDRIIAKSETDASSAADLKAELDNVEQDAIAALQPTATKVINADPSPPAPPQDPALQPGV